MKGIFKKTLACAIAACALTSSVTAFAAGEMIEKNSTPERTVTVNGVKYEKKGTSNWTSTKYYVTFNFKTEELKQKKVQQLNVVYTIMNYYTGAVVDGLSGISESAEDTYFVKADQSVSYQYSSKTVARCFHSAYQSGQFLLGDHDDDYTYVRT